MIPNRPQRDIPEPDRVTPEEAHRSQVPADPPHYAGHTPGYGANPTSQGVRGYRDLPAEDVQLINAVKELQENVADVWAAILVREGTDQRWANIAKTHLEEGISALVRSVAKPHDPFRAALQRVQADTEQRARDAVAADLRRAPTTHAEQAPESSTVDQNSAQPSHEHRPEEGNRP